MLATPLETATLPSGIRSRFVRGVNGLDIHILEAGYAPAGRPLVLLLHGFPEVAYSWRKVMPALAEGGFHAVAPDHRGHGRSTGWRRDADDPRGAGGAAETAQALPVVLRDADGQCPDHALPTGRAQFPARLLPPQERRLERQQAASARRLDRRRAGEDANLLYHGPVRRHAGGGRHGDAVGGGDRRQPMADRGGAVGLCR